MTDPIKSAQARGFLANVQHNRATLNTLIYECMPTEQFDNLVNNHGLFARFEMARDEIAMVLAEVISYD